MNDLAVIGTQSLQSMRKPAWAPVIAAVTAQVKQPYLAQAVAATRVVAPIRSAMWSPTRRAFAIAVSAGFTAPMLGKKLVSTT